MTIPPLVRATPVIGMSVFVLGLVTGAGFVAQKTDTKQTPPATATETPRTGDAEKPPPPPTRTDQAVALIKALTTWPLTGLALILIFRSPLRALLVKVTDSIGSSAVTFDAGSFKLQVAEPAAPPPAPDDGRSRWSRSPFEVEEDAADPAPALRDVAPQLRIPASDYVAQYWMVKLNDPKVAVMQRARNDLKRVCSDPARDFARLRTELDGFVGALDASLYLEADQFADLLGEHPTLRLGIEALAPKDLTADARDFLVLHAAGVAYAQKGKWTRAAAVLEKITWKDTDPLYVPAGSVWLTSRYHAGLEELERDHPEADLESTQFFGQVQQLMDRARRLLDALQRLQWDKARLSDRGYFVRELLKDLGSIGSILSDYAAAPVDQMNLLQRASVDLLQCAAPIDGAGPSPLDHNNLADVYRQIGDAARKNRVPAQAQEAYAKALEEVDRALADDSSDPTFYNTRAMVLFGRGDRPSALRALDLYTEAQANAASPRNIEQYVENQILAAKLLAAPVKGDESPDLARITWVLEEASTLLNGHRAALGDDSADNLQARIDEMLGYAYLKWPRRETAALQAFDRLFGLASWTPMDVVRIRCHVWRGRALIRVARTQRREFSGAVAAQLRERARTSLNALLNLLQAFKVDSSVRAYRRERNAALRLDVLLNLQSLAEEYLAGEETARAQHLADQEAELLSSLDKANLTGRAGLEMREQLERLTQRLAFLVGRIRIRMEPQTVELIGKVEEKFDAARGLNADQDCQIDLEFGDLLMRLARQGLGDPVRLYQRAVESFERAAGRTAPALRGDTIRGLSAAYAMRDTIMRTAKTKAGAPAH